MLGLPEVEGRVNLHSISMLSMRGKKAHISSGETSSDRRDATAQRILLVNDVEVGIMNVSLSNLNGVNVQLGEFFAPCRIITSELVSLGCIGNQLI